MATPRRLTQPSFVNRTSELEMLLAFLPPQMRSSKFIALRSPPGFGKSRLVDRVLSEIAADTVLVAVVDPHVRSSKKIDQAHDGYFLQLCAGEASRCVQQQSIKKPELSEFLRERRLQTVTEIKGRDVAKQGPTVRAAWTAVFDLFERATSRGDYSPDKILASDASHAVRICREYLSHVFDGLCSVVVLREAQHVDSESLKFFLNAVATFASLTVILEYTSRNNEFEPTHAKLISEHAEKGVEVVLHDLLKLGQHEADLLVNEITDGASPLEPEHLTDWDGNIRSLIEFRYRITLQTRVNSGSDIGNPFKRLEAQRKSELDQLSPREGFLLSVLAHHDGPLDRNMLVSLLYAQEPLATRASIEADIESIASSGRHIKLVGAEVTLRDDDVLDLINEAPVLRRYGPFSIKALRDYYVRAWRDGDFSALPRSRALRGAIVGCARTGDELTLRELLSEASSFVATAQSPSQYVELLSSTFEAFSPFSATARKYIADWAIEIAYGASDYLRAASLVESIPQSERSTFHELVHACSLQEIGRHPEARLIAERIDAAAIDAPTSLLAKLVLLLVEGAVGDEKRAEALFQGILTTPDFKDLPALGYAHRFGEMFYDFDICAYHLAESIRLFDAAQLVESASYSRISGAVHLARAGKIDEALTQFEQARIALASSIRDEHLIANNWAVLQMLRDVPDFAAVREALKAALFSVGDEFSELTILSNLVTAAVRTGDKDLVTSAVARMRAILDKPKFGEKGIYWDATHSAGDALRWLGRSDEVHDLNALRQSRCPARSVHSDYWLHRFDETLPASAKYRTMLRKPYHLSYLSHWTIDLDGLRALKRAQPL